MLDTFTLLILLIVSHFLSTAVMYLNWRLSPQVPGVKEWALGRILVSAGMVLFLGRGHIPLVVSVMLGNGLLFSGFYVVWLGARRFLGAPAFDPWPYYLGIAGFLAFFAYYCVVDDQLVMRSMASSAFNAIYSAGYVWVLLRYNRPQYLTVKMFAVAIGLHGLLHAWLVTSYSFLLPHNELLDTSAAYQIYFFAAFMISVISACLYIAMTAEYLQHDLKLQTSFDPLTRAINRRAFLPMARHAMECRKREVSPISLMMLDLDHFKSINDTYGHPAGDEVLRQVGVVLHQALRARDIICRYGGEEFLILCPVTESNDAGQVAERVRQSVEALEISYQDQTLRPTVSVGFVTYPSTCNLHDLDQFIATADQALYVAKRNGRNRVERGFPAR